MKLTQFAASISGDGGRERFMRSIERMFDNTETHVMYDMRQRKPFYTIENITRSDEE